VCAEWPPRRFTRNNHQHEAEQRRAPTNPPMAMPAMELSLNEEELDCEVPSEAVEVGAGMEVTEKVGAEG
jgi:hypothetical protein